MFILTCSDDKSN